VTEFKKIFENLVKAGDRQSEYYHRAKKNHLDAQLILSTFRQPLQFSGVSRFIIAGPSGRAVKGVGLRPLAC
jgi:hypothetical protein